MSQSEILFAQAQQHIPGGVNSPVRAFKAVGGTPLFIESAKGAYITDADGKDYIDFVQSWGPMVTGHADADILDAVSTQMQKGLSFGAPCELEVQMADTLCELIPNMEMVRMVNSGTEATMSAIRVARGYTGREMIVKFEGCYHGHSDSLLVKAGSGALTLGIPNSPGVPASLAEKTLTLTYNDIDGLKQAFAEYGDQIACVIVEPVAGNMSCIPPIPGFLEALREVCDNSGSVLIFDEVMTGFRVGLKGAQDVFGIDADMITLGKVIGAGMPVGAFGGKREIMESVAPLGAVYQAGTLSGNPLAMAAGLCMLKKIQTPGFYDQLSARTQQLVEGIQKAADDAGIPFTTNSVGSMFGLFFSDLDQVTNFAEVMSGNTERFNQFFHAMLDEGVYFAPACYEAGFMSGAHSEAHIDKVIEAAARVFAKLGGC